MPDRPIKIFISSTYNDLKSKRKMIIEVIRRLGHISKEMESFSAGRRHQWENIKKEIDDSDVVVVISASRYGTIFKDGLSFTESEIKYAKEKGKPLIPLLLANPTESKIDHKQKLKNFRQELEKITPKFFSNTSELLLELVCAIRDVEEHPKKWKISDKSTALKKLDNPEDWVVDHDDIYYEPNSEFGIEPDPLMEPTSNWKNSYDTFLSDTILKKEIWDRYVKQDMYGIALQFNFFDVKIVRFSRVLKRFRVNKFIIRHFPYLNDGGVYYLPAHEVLRDSLYDKGISSTTPENRLLEIIKGLPEYKVCRILFRNEKNKNFNTKESNDFILEYLEISFLKRILGL